MQFVNEYQQHQIFFFWLHTAYSQKSVTVIVCSFTKGEWAALGFKPLTQGIIKMHA